MTARTLRVDLHVHTRHSYDAGPEARVDRVLESARRAGLDGLAVTDHDRLAGSLAAVERAPEYGLLALPGVEVSTAEGHLLALGVRRRPTPGRSLLATVEAVRALGGLAVVPQPFQRSRHGAPRDAIVDCDGVEVYNAHHLTGVRNGQAEAFARRRGVARFGGSDAHHPAYVGRGYTAVEVPVADPDAADLLAALARGTPRPGGRRTPARRYLGKWLHNARLRTGEWLAGARRATGSLL